MDANVSNKFDFRKFAFSEDNDEIEDATTSLPPKIERKPVIKDSSDDESNDCFKTRSGRTIHNKFAAKTITLSSDDDSSEEDENDVFKVYQKLDSELNNKPKRIRENKVKIQNEQVDLNGKFVKLRKNKLKKEDDLNLSADFVPLKKSNKSITIDQDALSNPLKILSNKMNKIEVNGDKKFLNVPDEINMLLNEDSFDSTTSNNRKRKITMYVQINMLSK